MAYTHEVKFIRLDVTNTDSITHQLTEQLKDGWMVVSHAEADGEYSFVFKKATYVQDAYAQGYPIGDSL